MDAFKAVVSNDERPLITFALFAYNQEKFIREAVAGALSQTYFPLEIILSDDCSQDDTFELMKEMVRTYSGRNKVLLNRNERNLGIGEHVNKVFELSSGELVIMAAADDISISARCGKIVDAWIHAGMPAMIMSDWWIIDEVGNYEERVGKIANQFDSLGDRNSNIDLLRAYLISGNMLPLHGATAAYSKRLIDEFRRLNSNVIAEDYALYMRSLLLNGVAYIDEQLVMWRSHSCGVSYVDLYGKERYIIQMTRNIPSYENFLSDIHHAKSSKKISEREYMKLERPLTKLLRSSTFLRAWSEVSWVKRLFIYCPVILFSGPKRHKKWLFRNYIKPLLKPHYSLLRGK